MIPDWQLSEDLLSYYCKQSLTVALIFFSWYWRGFILAVLHAEMRPVRRTTGIRFSLQIIFVYFSVQGGKFATNPWCLSKCFITVWSLWRFCWWCRLWKTLLDTTFLTPRTLQSKHPVCPSLQASSHGGRAKDGWRGVLVGESGWSFRGPTAHCLIASPRKRAFKAFPSPQPSLTR